jgi:hypothetical protein
MGLTTPSHKKLIVGKPQVMKAGRINYRRPNKYKCLRLGTWNVLSLYGCGTLRSLISIVQEKKVDMLAIQEIRWISQFFLEKKECTLCTTKIKRLKFSKSHTGSDVIVQLAS